MNRSPACIILLMLLALPAWVSAALIDRGSGLIYDSDLDLTWSQAPSNLARWTSDNGSILSAAHFAAAHIQYDSVRSQNLGNWRLPTRTELGHLYFDELGNSGSLSNRGFFQELAAFTYWTGTVDPATVQSGMPHYYILNFANGAWDEDCGMLTMSDGNYVILARDGDVGPAGYELTLHFSGTGSGTVLDATGSRACNTDCALTFDAGTTVTLSPSNSDRFSSFSGWGGDCATASGDCVLTMDRAKSVTASFVRQPVYLNSPAGPHATIFTAYEEASSSASIWLQETSFTEELYFAHDKQITLTGGYDVMFTDTAGEAVIHGAVTIGLGSVTMANIIIS